MIPSAFILSPTGLRAQQQKKHYSPAYRSTESVTSESSLTTYTTDEGDEYSTITGKITPLKSFPSPCPRRRLLFITPYGLTNSSTEESLSKGRHIGSSKTNCHRAKYVSHGDLRPRWVDLNKYYKRLRASDTALNSMTIYEDELPNSGWKHSKANHNRKKVASWLGDGKSTPSKSTNSEKGTASKMMNFTSSEVETQL